MTTPYTYWSNFLADDMIEDIREKVRTNLANMENARVSKTLPSQEIDRVVSDEFRSSSILFHHHYMELAERFTKRVHEYYPFWSDYFGLELTPFENHFEVQCTGHGDNDFFGMHNDNGSSDTAHRLLTVVYYFNMTPEKRWSGGELEIVGADRLIVPEHNHIVAFQSHIMHEVKRVRVPSRNFFDGRWTLNNWLWKKNSTYP